MHELTTRLIDIRRRIQTACDASGRSPDEITIIAVTKTFSTEAIDTALAAGLTHVGENRVQEAESKVEIVRGRATFHLIGHLQSNKAKKAVGLFDWIQTIDDMTIAREMSKRAVEADRKLNVLIEVNSSGESQKHGCQPNETVNLARSVHALPNLTLRGIMTIGPLTADTSRIAFSFESTRELFNHLCADYGDEIDTLSMGMSDDFELAIRHGSTMIRLGSALFGER